MHWEHLVRVFMELLLLGWGCWITYKNKDRSKVLMKREEQLRRQRIEIVLQEEKIEDLEQELKFQKAAIQHHRTRSESRKLRSASRAHQLKEILGGQVEQKEIDEIFKDGELDSKEMTRLQDLMDFDI